MANTADVAQGNTDATTETVTTDNATETTDMATDTTDTKETETATTTETAMEAPQIDAGAFTLPEGFTMDTKALEEFMPIAKELGMNQEQAQKAINLHANVIKSTVERMAAAQATAFQAGVDEIKTSFGPKYDENMGKVEKLLKEYGGDDAVSQAKSGIYGNKVMVGALLKIAEAAGPGRFINGKQGTDERSTGNILFGEALAKSNE